MRKPRLRRDRKQLTVPVLLEPRERVHQRLGRRAPLAPRGRLDVGEPDAEADQHAACQQGPRQRALVVREQRQQRRFDRTVLRPGDLEGRVEHERVGKPAHARAARQDVADLGLLVRQRTAVVRAHRGARERQSHRDAVRRLDEGVRELATHLRLGDGPEPRVDAAALAGNRETRSSRPAAART